MRCIMTIMAVTLTVTVLAPVSSWAGIDSLLDNIVGGTYVQEPGLYKSPSTTTLSLGSTSIRMKSDVIKRPLLSITEPRVTMSCAGLDFDAGMLGIMNLDLFEKMLTQAGASAMWGVMLGLAYSLPGVKTTFDSLQEFSRWPQLLTQNACVLAKNYVRERMDRKRSERAEEKVALGEVSDYSQALKDIARSIRQKDVIQTIPFSSLVRGGITDRELQELLASWFGLLDIYLVDENNNRVPATNPTKVIANACGSRPCSYKNIRTKSYPRLLSNITPLLHGGDVAVWTCQMSVEGGACNNEPVQKTITTVGLKKKIKDKLSEFRDRLVSESSELKSVLESNRDLYAFARVVPNYFDVVSYAAALKKTGKAELVDMSETVLSNTSEYIALRLLYQFGSIAKERLAEAIGMDAELADKVDGKDIKAYIKGLDEADRAMKSLIQDMNEMHQMYVNNYRNFVSLRDYSNAAVQDLFGRGVKLNKINLGQIGY